MNQSDSTKTVRCSSRNPKYAATISTPTQELAAAVIEVIPAVMDSIRVAMRRRAGDQLSVPQYHCLNVISRKPGCSIGTNAGFLGVTLPTASAMVDRLVKAGSVVAQTASEDRRRSQVHATQSGLAQLEQIRDTAQYNLKRALAAGNARELQELQAGLAILRRIFRPNAEPS